MEQIKNCEVCKLPLHEPEARLNRNWHFDCEKCQYCGDSDGLEQYPTRIADCLTAGIPISHVTCHKTAMFADFKNKVIPVTKAHIQALNAEINSFFPAIAPDTSDVKLLFDLLISLQETATNVSYALSLTKDKLLVKESQTFDTQQKEKQAKKREESFQSETEKLAAQARTAQLAAERANPALRYRRKAIEGWITMGMSEAEATAMVDKIEKKENPIQ